MDASDPDLPDATVEHISQMLTLAKSKHQEAMALLGAPDPNALPRLREVLRLLGKSNCWPMTRQAMSRLA